MVSIILEVVYKIICVPIHTVLQLQVGTIIKCIVILTTLELWVALAIRWVVIIIYHLLEDGT